MTTRVFANLPEALDYLMSDGDLACFSPYGDRTSECAPIAIALGEIVQAATEGGPITSDLLDGMMSQVVNGSDDVRSILSDHAGLDPEAAGARITARIGAYRRGVEAAEAAASWVIDGNSEESVIPALLRMISDGDPAADDYFPARPNLSGEWADAPTPRSLFEDLTGMDAHAESSWNHEAYSAYVEDLCEAFESGVDDTFEAAIERILRERIALDLEEVEAGYIECALWSTNADHLDPEGTGAAGALQDHFSPEDLDPEAREAMREELRAFLMSEAADLYGIEASQAGHDLLLTRNRHGAGFWDRGLGDRGERLSEAARALGEANFYAGDDGKLYVS